MYSAIDFYYICWILWSKEYTTIQALTFIYIFIRCILVFMLLINVTHEFQPKHQSQTFPYIPEFI